MLTLRDYRMRLCRSLFWLSLVPGLVYLVVFLSGPHDPIATFVFFVLYFVAFVCVARKFIEAKQELNEALEFRKVQVATVEPDSPAPPISV